MRTITLLAQLQNIPREQREPLYRQIESEHGRRFAASLRDMIDADEMISENERSVR